MLRSTQDDAPKRAPLAFFNALARAHSRVFFSNQRRIAQQLGKQSAQFDAYERRYKAHGKSTQKPIEKGQLIGASKRAKFVFVGDYHTLAKSRSYFLNLCETLVENKARIALALEYFATPEQAALDAFVDGSLSERDLQKRTHRDGRLAIGDAAWHSYAPLLHFARRNHIPIFALDAPRRGGASLAARDGHAARVLAKAHRKNPRLQICVLAGQLHVAPCHLPKAVQVALCKTKAYKGALKAIDGVVIYQNSEALFLRQLKRGVVPLGQTLRLNQRTFVAMHTAPIAAQQSFLRALEAGHNEPFAYDLSEQICETARLAAQFLDLKLPRGLDAWEAIAAVPRGTKGLHLGHHPIAKAQKRALLARLHLGLPAWLPEAQRLWIPANLLDETPSPALAGVLLWLHAQSAHKRIRRASACARSELRLGEALAAAAGVVCAHLLHPEVSGGENLRVQSRAVGDALGYDLGRALLHGLGTGRIKLEQIVALFAPKTPTMAGFARWLRLANLTP